jgi:hypothetical protein
LTSTQRSQISWPTFTVVVIVEVSEVRFAAALPSSAAATLVAPGCGLVKSSGLWSVHPVAGTLASVITPALATWYWKSTVCGSGVPGPGQGFVAHPPCRHCSPKKLTFSDVIVAPVLLTNRTA